MEEKVTMWLKNSFSDRWLMMRLNLSLNEVKNFKEKLRLLKKVILSLGYKQGLSFEKSKEPNMFTASKTLKSFRKVWKMKVAGLFKYVLNSMM